MIQETENLQFETGNVSQLKTILAFLCHRKSNERTLFFLFSWYSSEVRDFLIVTLKKSTTMIWRKKRSKTEFLKHYWRFRTLGAPDFRYKEEINPFSFHGPTKGDRLCLRFWNKESKKSKEWFLKLRVGVLKKTEIHSVALSNH